MSEEQNLHYLSDLSKYKVASNDPDVRGWKVRGSDKKEVGQVESFLVNKDTEKVHYLNIKVNEEIISKNHEPYKEGVKSPHEYVNKDGDIYLLVPTKLVNLDKENKMVGVPKVSSDTFSRTKRLSSEQPVKQEYEEYINRVYSKGN